MLYVVDTDLSGARELPLQARPSLRWPSPTCGRQNRGAMSPGFPRIDKAVLLGPTALTRAAALRASRPEERWLLRQPRLVRTSYVKKVLDTEGEPNAEEIWMLRQSKAVRESYIREVLGGGSARRKK